MTVEEPKTTDAEGAESTPETSGDETETATGNPEAAASETASVEAASAGTPEAGEAAPGSDVSDERGEVDTATPGEAAAHQPASEPETGAEPETATQPEAAAKPEAAAEKPETQSVTAEARDTGPPSAPAEAQDDRQATEPEAPAEARDDRQATEPEAPAEARESDAAAAAPFDDRPEPTTMAELLAEQPGDIPSLKHGDVVEGKIVRIDKDEMLVDVGAKSEGVVSNRELYGRNAESQPELKVGETVLVYVLQPESSDGHAVLSVRRAGLERKWRGMQELFDEGVIIDAPVIDHNKGGLIVDCGIRGFVPISQIVDFPRRPQNDQPRDAAQEIAEKLQPYVGRKLRLKILEVNRKANRLILSEKVALYEERREKRDELFSSLQVGQRVTGTVRSIAPFGIFVDLGGIDGLVHKSELSWNKVNNPEGTHEVGDEVEAEVIDINHERGRISLSIRRLLPDPWQSTVADLKVGDIVDGTVTKIVNFGAFVRVKDGLEGLIHISELSHQRVAHPGDVVHEGQTLKLKVISLDSERHRLGLSLKQAEEAPARPPRERRPRGERAGYDRSQAIQEPEGGIDNTLAAAFAQVRQQIAEQDAGDEGVAGAAQASAADAGAADTPTAADTTPAAEPATPAADASADEAATVAADPTTDEEATATFASTGAPAAQEGDDEVAAQGAAESDATAEAADEPAASAVTQPSEAPEAESPEAESPEAESPEAEAPGSDQPEATEDVAPEPAAVPAETDAGSADGADDEVASGSDDSDESRAAEEDRA